MTNYNGRTSEDIRAMYYTHITNKKAIATIFLSSIFKPNNEWNEWEKEKHGRKEIGVYLIYIFDLFHFS